MHHWKQIAWNCFRLISNGVTQDFKDYGQLYAHCVRNGINATQV